MQIAVIITKVICSKQTFRTEFNEVLWQTEMRRTNYAAWWNEISLKERNQRATILGAQIESRRELEEQSALGDITTQLFPEHGDFFGVSQNAGSKCLGMLSVFVKEGRSKLRHAGSLWKHGGILADESVNLLESLKPHLHSSSKHEVDRYLKGKKLPFTRQITEFAVHKLCKRPEGKYFSWLQMGATQVEYVNPLKLAAALKTLKINSERVRLQGDECIYVIHKLCHSEKLYYYPSKMYESSSWFGGDPSAIEATIEKQTKAWGRAVICDDIPGPRAFCLCRVPISKDGSLGPPDYSVKLIPTYPYLEGGDNFFHAEVLDFDFTSWLATNVKQMLTKRIWQPALRDLYICLTRDDRKEALQFLLDALKMFRTNDELPVQMVDISRALSSPPRCLASHSSILSRFLRGVGIVLMEPTSPHDSDEEGTETQIVFQPANSQEYLKILVFLLTMLVKEVVTHEQGETASKLLASEIVSLQELFFTQMCCVCSPWKALNPREDPLKTLWQKSRKTRLYLESLGLREEKDRGQAVVLCPEKCQLMNILFLFFSEMD